MLIMMMCACSQEHPAEGHPPGYAACDPFAVAVALYPTIAVQACTVYCDVELEGNLTRGQSVFDFKNIWHRQPNVRIVQQLDGAQFQMHMLKSLA